MVNNPYPRRNQSVTANLNVLTYIKFDTFSYKYIITYFYDSPHLPRAIDFNCYITFKGHIITY